MRGGGGGQGKLEGSLCAYPVWEEGERRGLRKFLCGCKTDLGGQAMVLSHLPFDLLEAGEGSLPPGTLFILWGVIVLSLRGLLIFWRPGWEVLLPRGDGGEKGL